MIRSCLPSHTARKAASARFRSDVRLRCQSALTPLLASAEDPNVHGEMIRQMARLLRDCGRDSLGLASTVALFGKLSEQDFANPKACADSNVFALFEPISHPTNQTSGVG